MDGFLYKRDPQNPTPPVGGGGGSLQYLNTTAVLY